MIEVSGEDKIVGIKEYLFLLIFLLSYMTPQIKFKAL